MPRDPKDTSVSGGERRQRRLAEALDIKEPAILRSGGGAAGPEGKAGEDGATWLSGTTVPSTELGVVGDFYLRTTTSDVYKKTSEAVWSFQVNIEGEKGETGAEGKEGAAGKEGPAGSAENIDWKNSVRAATTANIATSTALNPGDAIDGVTLVENDRVLVKDQTTKSQNGIWVVKAVPARALDADAAAELSGGSTIYVEEGTRNKRRTFQIITPGNITPGTTAHEYLQLGFKDFGLVEALPTSEAVKNDKCSYYANKANGVVWDLIYDGEGEYPWKKIGGAPLIDEVATAQNTGSATYADLATVGPSLTTPLKGDYMVSTGCYSYTNSSFAFMSYSIGASAAVDADSTAHGLSDAAMHSRTARKTALAASAALVAKYKAGATLAEFAKRWITIDPIRVG
jgi:hypothetical protein